MKTSMDWGKSPPMDRRQVSMSVSHGSSVHGGAARQRWCKSSDGLWGDFDGLEKPGATVVLHLEWMAWRRAREALAASAQNCHPSYEDLASGSKLVKIEHWVQTQPRKPAEESFLISYFKTGGSFWTAGYVPYIQARHGEEDQSVIIVIRLYLLHFSPSGRL